MIKLNKRVKNSFNPRTPCGVRLNKQKYVYHCLRFQSTHSLRSATIFQPYCDTRYLVSIHALLAECDFHIHLSKINFNSFNPRTPCGVRLYFCFLSQKTTCFNPRTPCGVRPPEQQQLLLAHRFNPRTPCGVRLQTFQRFLYQQNASFQSTHSLRSATAPNLIHCYSTKQIILCANLPKKTVIARLLFLSIYLSIFYSQCITPIADLPGNSCELEVGAQAMFNSL